MAKKKPNNDRKKYKNMTIEDRIRLVENLYIHFPRNEDALKAIADCHKHARRAGEAEGLIIQGETGAGKTTIIKQYTRDHPRTVTDDGSIVPVLRASVPVPATCKSLATTLLTAIGDPAADKGTNVSQSLRLKRFFEVCKVELVILDEFQHFQDRDSRKVLKTVSDWLKLLMDQTHVPIVLAGLPYSHTILDEPGNQQLQRRFATRIELEPFAYETKKDRQDFRRFLNAIDDRLPLLEKSNLADPDMALCIYAATDGVVAHVMKLVRRATMIALESGEEQLTMSTLSLAYEQRLASNNPSKANPFGEIAIAA